MNVTVTLPAPPKTIHGTGRRRRAVAIGSGFGGLTATKALKHSQMGINDALVFLTRIIAQGTHVFNQTSLWLQIIPATAAASTTIGVLIALRRQRTDTSQPECTDRRALIAVGNDEIMTAASDSGRRRRLWRSRQTSKGWF